MRSQIRRLTVVLAKARFVRAYWSQLKNGKSVERRRRKATGLRDESLTIAGLPGKRNQRLRSFRMPLTARIASLLPFSFRVLSAPGFCVSCLTDCLTNGTCQVMKTIRCLYKFAIVASLSLSLSACLLGDQDESENTAGFAIQFTSPAEVSVLLTPDIVINISGTVSSNSDVQEVSWQNDRGGQGMADGTAEWVTGNIMLQLGLNKITITAKYVDGKSSKRSLTVERENTATTGGNGSGIDPVLFYSYQSDLSNAAPVLGASIMPRQIFLFLDPGDDWTARGIRNVQYLCCKGQSGPGVGSPYDPMQVVVGKPWLLPVDLTGLQVGGTRRIKVRAEFNDGTISDPPVFDFLIAENQPTGNSAPVISGIPSASATVGNQYSFRPTAQDPNGDTMSFSIRNKPRWASFSQATGRLFGTPTSNDVGTQSTIVISVSDGRTSSSLPAFSISVAAFANGAATLSWTVPTERTDNTPLTNLAGFNIYFGQTSGDYSNKVVVNNIGITTYVVENLSGGTWYFSVTAVDAGGLESNPSNEGNKFF